MATNILYTYANTEELGGADYCLLKLATSLDPSKFKVMVALSKPTPLEKNYSENGIKVFYVGMPRLQKTKNPFRIIGYLISGIISIVALVTIILRNNINIVHSNDLLDIWGPIAAKITKKKSVHHVRMILPPGVLVSFLEWFMNIFVDKVVPVSNGTRDHLPGLRSEKVEVIYDWLDPQKIGHSIESKPIRDEFDISSGTIIIGIVGRLQEWKGQHLAIEAFNIVKKQIANCVLIICGGEVHGKHRKYAKYLCIMADKLGIKDSVVFTGYRSDIINIMRGLDIFIHCSTTPDPLPGVVMEASYCGIPVIGPQAGGVPEEIQDGETGFLYSPGAADALANKIIQTIQLGKSKRHDIGENGKTFVENKFDKEKLVGDFISLYSSIRVTNAIS